MGACIIHVVIICPPCVGFPLIMYYSNFVYCRLGTETKIITTLDQNERWTCIQDRAEDQTRKTQKLKLENIHIKDKVYKIFPILFAYFFTRTSSEI